MSKVRFPELGFYALPGYSQSPKPMFEEVADGEELGLGSVWISERFNTKDIGVISGVAAALSPNMGIASGLIGNLPIRHPIAVASYASTMASLTDDRFSLGLGRGIDVLADMTGTPRIGFHVLEDYIDILRRLWRGEVVHYEGVLGEMSNMGLGMAWETPPPIIMAAMGAKTCEWAGKHCDGVVYNSLWTKDAIGRSTAILRKSAEEAGRNPDDIRVWAIQVTACETSEEDVLNYIIRRMNTYVFFPHMFEALCKFNGWDLGIVDKVRAAIADADGAGSSGGVGDEHTTRELDALRRIRDLYPEEWVYQGNAVGSAKDCARATRERLDAGADGILLHGSPPKKLKPLIDIWAHYRPEGRFDDRSVNPGL